MEPLLPEVRAAWINFCAALSQDNLGKLQQYLLSVYFVDRGKVPIVHIWSTFVVPVRALGTRNMSKTQ